MDTRAPSRIIASCFALSAFAIALIAGLAADRSASAILSTAVIALITCYILGLVIASAANVAVGDRIEQIKAEKPVPTYSKPAKTTPSSSSGKQSSQAA